MISCPLFYMISFSRMPNTLDQLDWSPNILWSFLFPMFQLFISLLFSPENFLNFFCQTLLQIASAIVTSNHSSCSLYLLLHSILSFFFTIFFLTLLMIDYFILPLRFLFSCIVSIFSRMLLHICLFWPHGTDFSQMYVWWYSAISSYFKVGDYKVDWKFCACSSL